MSAQHHNSKRSPVLLEAIGIGKAFPGVQALDDVHITARGGRLNALLGENGAGKSTLMNILAGVTAPDRGQITLDGRPIRFQHPSDAQAAGIAIIHQELNLVPDLSIVENIFLGREPLNRWGLIDSRRMEVQAQRLLGQLGVEESPRTPVGRLRVGVQQIVEIAKALSLDAQVIIMDEPTSALSDHEIASLFALIHQLKRREVAIIYISHKLDELNQIADDVTVLRDGRFIAAKEFKDTTRDEIVRLMVGRELQEPILRPSTSTAEMLRVENVSLWTAKRSNEFRIQDISFAVGRGEVLGLFGLMGAGRTELLQTLFGVHPRLSSGRVFIEGRHVRIRSPQDAIHAGLALAPEDRKREGLVLSMNVAENASLACLNQVARLGFLQPSREGTLVQSFLKRLRIKCSSPQQGVRQLSGGNQQKVVLSKWLAARPKVLLLDEPTRGIDIHAKSEMVRLVHELAGDGLAVLLVSSELPELLTLADRILVMSEGRLTAEFDRKDATEEKLLHAALPQHQASEVISA